MVVYKPRIDRMCQCWRYARGHLENTWQLIEQQGRADLQAQAVFFCSQRVFEWQAEALRRYGEDEGWGKGLEKKRLLKSFMLCHVHLHLERSEAF